MRNTLFQAICRTGIFMICAQAIVHFRPQESYEKYLKLLVSAMILLQLFLPLGSFLAGIGGDAAMGQLDSFRKSLEQSMEEAREHAEETDALLEKMTLEEVRRRMETQTAQDSQDAERDLAEQSFEADPPRQSGHQTEGISVEIQDISEEIESNYRDIKIED